MFIPARKTRGSDQACTRLPRLLTFAASGAVFMGAGFGVVPASADPRADNELSVMVDIVGDSYMAGVGLRDTYIDPADPRHRSTAAPALQALARVQSDNPLLRVDANLAAASGAETADFFHAQAGPNNVLVNAPQRDQVRPDSQLVIVGFGGEDAQLATVLAEARRTTGGPNTALDKQIRELGPLLDWTLSDEEYIAQAKSSAPGQASTLVARMLQVVAGIADRAPHAKIVVTTYPLAADPQDEHASSLVGEDELTSVRKFGYDLNQAINRAVQICACGSLADVSEAMAGHEIYTVDSAFNESRDQQAPQESFQPNEEGASLIANPIANVVANVLRITVPKPSDGRTTVPENIEIRGGVPDRDGDRVVDFEDRAPDDPARSTDTPRDGVDTKHGRDDSRRGSRSDHGNDSRQPRDSVLPTILPVVDGLAPGMSPIDPYGQPPTDPTGDNHPGTVESRPSAREQIVPVESPALAPEPATAPPVPGQDGSSLSQAEIAAVEDVVSKAVPAGYVSQYPTQALRVTTVPADVRAVSDKAAVDAQMSWSFLTDQYGFRARFGENIDAIHNATTVEEQDAAIARFNQTAREYNATELAARDAYGAHPVDAQGETVRVTPISVADLAAQTPSYGPVEATTLPAFDGLKTGTVVDPGPLGVPSAQADTSTLAADSDEAQAVAGETATYGPVDVTSMAAVSDQASAQTVTVADVAGETTLSAQADMSTLAAAGSPKSAPAKSAKPGVSVKSDPDFSRSAKGAVFGPGEVSESAEKDGVTVTGKAQGQALGYEGTITGDSGPEGMSGKISGKATFGEGSLGVTAKSKNGEGGYEANGAIGAEVGLGGKLNGINDFGLSANGKIGGTASVGDSGNYGLLEGSRKAEVGVGADFDATTKVSPDGFKIGSHASFGAKAKAEAKIGVPGFSVDFTGTAFAGPGYDYGIRFGKQEDGKYKFGVTAGFSPLVGAAGGFDVTVDPDKLQQSVQKAIDALNPFGPDQMNSPRSMAQDDPNYDGPTDSPVESQMDSPRSRAEDDPNYDGPTDSPAKTQMNSPRSQAQDDPGYDGPTDSPADAPGESQMNSPRSQAQDDPGYDGPTDSPADAPGESQMNSPRSQSQDDPNYDGPTDSISDAAISSNTVDSETDMASLGDTMTGAEGVDSLSGNVGTDSLGDTGYGDTDLGDSNMGLGDSGFGNDAGLGDSGLGDSGVGGDSGMGGDSGGFGGDSGMGGDSGGLGGDSGMGGDSSGGMGGDGGGDGGSSSGGDGGGGDGGSSSGGMGGGDGGGF